MTPKPSEAELRELERLEKAATPGPWTIEVIALRPRVDGEQIEGMGEGGRERVCSFENRDPPDPNAALIVAARNALPGLLAHVRRLEIALLEVIVTMGLANRDLQERAEAAEKRAGELGALHSGRDACQLRNEVEDLRGGLEAAEAELAALRATPAAAVREALEACKEALASSGFADTNQEERAASAIAKAESALAGAEAGERETTATKERA